MKTGCKEQTVKRRQTDEQIEKEGKLFQYGAIKKGGWRTDRQNEKNRRTDTGGKRGRRQGRRKGKLLQ